MGNVAALGTLPAPSRNNTAGKRGPKRSAIAGRRRAQIRRVSPPPGILGKGAGHSVARSAYFVRLRSQKAAFWQDIAEMYSSTAFFQLKAYKMCQFCQNRLSERTFQRNLARKSPSGYAGVQNNHFLPHFARSLGRGAETFRRMLHLNPFNLHCPLLSHLFRIHFSSLSHLFPMPSIASSYGIFSWIRNSIGMSSGA